MSSTTRVGFLIPAVGDQADEILYYDNNVTVYENELPGLVVGSLPVSGNYAGRIRDLNVAQTSNPPAPNMPYDEYVYNGSAWVPFSAAGLRKSLSYSLVGDSSGVTASGTEVFSSALSGFNAIQVQVGSIVKFMCQIHLAQGSTGSDFTFNGKFNIFVNPSSSTQPTPTTVGAVRLSFPMVESSDIYATSGTPNPVDYFYGEMLYAANFNGNIGVGAYLSATSDMANDYIHDPTLDSWPVTVPNNGCNILTELCGTWSG